MDLDEWIIARLRKLILELNWHVRRQTFQLLLFAQMTLLRLENLLSETFITGAGTITTPYR